LFIVGHLGGIARPKILALGEGLRGHPAPSREAGENVAACLGVRSASGSDERGDLSSNIQVTGVDTYNSTLSGNVSIPVRASAGQRPIDAPCVMTHTVQPVAFTPESVHMDGTREDGTHHPLRCSGHAAIDQPRPRRLTPVECERLQGFPDGWTARGTTDEGDHRQLADGPRYRMMGNAVTVNVAEWIGARIMGDV
jgi:site-specific DNA-cytosine methylase